MRLSTAIVNLTKKNIIQAFNLGLDEYGYSLIEYLEKYGYSYVCIDSLEELAQKQDHILYGDKASKRRSEFCTQLEEARSGVFSYSPKDEHNAKTKQKWVRSGKAARKAASRA